MKSLKHILPIALFSLAPAMSEISSQANRPENKYAKGEILKATDTLGLKETEKGVPKKKKEFMNEVNSYIGIPYKWGGRNTENLPGMDCMGVPFKAYAETFEEDWRDYNVNLPGRLIENNTLGKPVQGLDGVLNKNINKKKFKDMEKGDIVYFMKNKFEKDRVSIYENGRNEYTVGHMGVYAGNEKVINAFAPGTDVRKEDLEKLSREWFSGIYVTRPDWKGVD